MAHVSGVNSVSFAATCILLECAPSRGRHSSLIRFRHPPLFIERSVPQQVDGGHRFVARNEALAEITQEVVMTRLRPLRNHATAGLAEFVLHSQARKCAEDSTNISGIEHVKPETP